VPLGPALDLGTTPASWLLRGRRRERRVVVGYLTSALGADGQVAPDPGRVPEFPIVSGRNPTNAKVPIQEADNRGMTRTRLLVGLAIVVAIALMLYARGDRRLGDYHPSATVVVATEDIPNGARLDPLIMKGIFVEVQIPRDALIEDAVTDIRQLEGLRTVAVIVKNEQISPYRLTNPGLSD
jgi:hypothetical protein